MLPGGVGIEVTGLSGAAWPAAYAVFALRCANMLARPRADGHDG